MKTIILIVFVIFLVGCAQQPIPVQQPTNESYAPKIFVSDFSTTIDNPYLSFPVGKKMIYEGETEEGLERIEVYVTDEVKYVMGVKTRVVWDRVWLDDELIEDTKDWYAQDDEGNVWYFGEDSFELLGGEIINHAGSWEAGVDGALPGIVMFANPKVGEEYRQEYYEDVAEDMGEVLSFGERVTTPYGVLSGCLQTRDFTPLEPDVDEHKYYCLQVGGVALEVVLEDDERVELISVEYDAEPTLPTVEEQEPENVITRISVAEARSIALGEARGDLTDIELEQRLGKLVYIVEIDDDGYETDVIIDAFTGEVLAVEE